MNVLVLGGTVFFGRHLVVELLARGHRVTTFNRGTHDVDGELPVTRLLGDRTRSADLLRIPSEGWDAVVDPSSDDPANVAAAARHLAHAGRYVYISSVSAYDLPNAPAVIDESAPVITDPGDDPNAATPEAFGWRKATCETRVAQTFGERATAIRPGLIVGPFDPTDRFTYWPVRIARGGHVLVPGPPEREIQFVDARDVAAFVVNAIERDLAGRYNVTSPRGALRMRDLIDAARDDIRALPAVHWVDGEFLVEAGCGGWSDLPLWLPANSPYRAIFSVDVSRALSAGLQLRALAATIRDTRDWFSRTGRSHLACGLDSNRETELLDQWNAVISS
jgi:2'-hydroxyisoflavone reductase